MIFKMIDMCSPSLEALINEITNKLARFHVGFEEAIPHQLPHAP